MQYVGRQLLGWKPLCLTHTKRRLYITLYQSPSVYGHNSGIVAEIDLRTMEGRVWPHKFSGIFGIAAAKGRIFVSQFDCIKCFRAFDGSLQSAWGTHGT